MGQNIVGDCSSFGYKIWEKFCTISKKTAFIQWNIYRPYTYAPFRSISSLNKANIWNVDTGAAFTGAVSIMDINTKDFWQSEPLPHLYPNEKGRNPWSVNKLWWQCCKFKFWKIINSWSLNFFYCLAFRGWCLDKILTSHHMKRETAISPLLMMRWILSTRICLKLQKHSVPAKGEDDNGKPIYVVVLIRLKRK